MARDPIDILFQKTDELEKKQTTFEANQMLHDHRLAAMEKNHAEMCRQLVLTEGKLMKSIDDLGAKQDNLISRLDIQEGARSAVKYIPSFFQVVIAISTLFMLVRSFK